MRRHPLVPFASFHSRRATGIVLNSETPPARSVSDGGGSGFHRHGCASPMGEARFAKPHGGPSMRFPSISEIARSCARHPWRVIAARVIVLVAAGFSASGLGDALTTSTNFTGKLESQKGAELLEHRLRGPQPVSETVIVRSDTD